MHKNAILIVLSMKSVAVLIEDGIFALFFIPDKRDLAVQVFPPLGICHQRQKMVMRGVSSEEVKLTDAIIPCGKYTVGLVSCCLS